MGFPAKTSLCFYDTFKIYNRGLKYALMIDSEWLLAVLAIFTDKLSRFPTDFREFTISGLWQPRL